MGNPDLIYERHELRQGFSDIVRFNFVQLYQAKVDAWNIAKVKVRAVYGDRREAVEVMAMSPWWSCDLADDSYERLEVEVVYGDGLVVKGEIMAPYDDAGHEAAFLTRPRAADIDPL